MGNAEKNVYIALISTVIVFVCYCLILIIYWEDYQTTDATRLVGKSIFFLMIASAVTNFGLRALLKIISSIRNPSCEPSIVDERDKMIELNGLQVSYLVFTLGFVTAMLTLWSGCSPDIAFNIIIFSLALGEILSGTVKIIQYRRGF
jgi:hypothetical protein